MEVTDTGKLVNYADNHIGMLLVFATTQFIMLNFLSNIFQKTVVAAMNQIRPFDKEIDKIKTANAFARLIRYSLAVWYASYYFQQEIIFDMRNVSIMFSNLLHEKVGSLGVFFSSHMDHIARFIVIQLAYYAQELVSRFLFYYQYKEWNNMYVMHDIISILLTASALTTNDGIRLSLLVVYLHDAVDIPLCISYIIDKWKYSKWFAPPVYLCLASSYFFWRLYVYPMHILNAYFNPGVHRICFAFTVLLYIIHVIWSFKILVIGIRGIQTGVFSEDSQFVLQYAQKMTRNESLSQDSFKSKNNSPPPNQTDKESKKPEVKRRRTKKSE